MRLIVSTLLTKINPCTLLLILRKFYRHLLENQSYSTTQESMLYTTSPFKSVNRRVLYFIWGESEGKRVSNEIFSIMKRYLQDVDTRNEIKELALYSDNCTGHQKNQSVLAVLIGQC